MDLQYPVISITYPFFVQCSSEATLRPDLPPSTVMFLSSVGAPLLRPGLHTHRPHHWASNIPGVRGQRPRGGRAAATLLQPGALPLPSDTTEIGKRKREGPSNSMEKAPSFSALLLTFSKTAAAHLAHPFRPADQYLATGSGHAQDPGHYGRDDLRGPPGRTRSGRSS